MERRAYEVEILAGDGLSVSQAVNTVLGVDYLTFKIGSDGTAPLGVTEIKWKCSAVDVHAFWRPNVDRNRNLLVNWDSDIAKSAPVGCFFSSLGLNRLTFAFSDALNRVRIRASVNEETGVLHCSMFLFEGNVPPLREYEAVLRLDCREIPYHDVLGDVEAWWRNGDTDRLFPVPLAAREPAYSTWYSMHQDLSAERIEQQCSLAKAFGCEVVIVDDGWQTTGLQRGYAYCGDWNVSENKISDMAAHVARVHAMGMRYVLWYAVPFVGKHSRVWSQFQDKLLGEIDRLGAGVLDPRFPEVRAHLVQVYESAVRDWDLDGLKLDFIDSFSDVPEGERLTGGGRDMDSVPLAVNALMAEIARRIREHKPDALIEFRQNYVGPLMRGYGNMFRAADCPYDALQNRVRTIDVRLLCGETAAHADMLMWHGEERAETAALQIINVLFAVPQISVRLDELSLDHAAMLKFWLGFWRQNRDVLLDGQLRPAHPELLYPMVTACTPEKLLIVAYADVVLELEGVSQESSVILVNGTQKDHLVVDVRKDIPDSKVVVRDCRGVVVDQFRQAFSKGLHRMWAPESGLITLAVPVSVAKSDH